VPAPDQLELSNLTVGVMDADPGFTNVLARRLEDAGARIAIMRGPTPAEALVPMRLNALIVDPVVFGADVWRRLEVIAGHLPGLPIVVCAGPTSVGQRIRGLRLGIEDWITKPCHPEEVLARIEAIVRRRRRNEAGRNEPIAVGEIEIRPELFQAFVAGRSADLTRREFELLQLLAGVNGQVLPREEIYERIWGFTMAHGDRSVDVFVRKLRAKLDVLSPGWRYVHTHFAIGYRLAAEPREGAERPAAEPAGPDGKSFTTW
jgi:DNA-binding response OmpR family regulator